MRIRFCAIVGIALVAGCDAGNKTETVEFKKTDVSHLDAMKDAMTKQVKSGNYTQKAAPAAPTK